LLFSLHTGDMKACDVKGCHISREKSNTTH